jgi:timeless
MECTYRFSTPEMMLQYGRLLESFQENGKFVNDCIFTMMHHISGDMNQVGALFQPGILKTFSLIWEQDFEVCDVSISKTVPSSIFKLLSFTGLVRFD